MSWSVVHVELYFHDFKRHALESLVANLASQSLRYAVDELFWV